MGAARKNFGPSYFVMALVGIFENQGIFSSHIHNIIGSVGIIGA